MGEQELKEKEEERCREEARRKEQERQRQEVYAAALQAEEEKDFRVWIAREGFKDVNQKRKKFFFSFTYPLHVAVAENNAPVVRRLVEAGADKKKKNSSGLTPEQLARKMSKKLGINRTWDLTLDALR